MPKRKSDNVVIPPASKKQKHNCDICLTSHPDSELVESCPTHHFCKESLSRYVHIKVKDGEHDISCPALKCNRRLSRSNIKAMTDEKTFDMYKVLNLPITTARTSECPRCGNLTHLKKTSRYKIITCGKCEVEYCVLHGGAHPGRSCAEYVQDKSYQASIDTVVAISQSCPRCEAPTVKIDGCTNMTCTICGKRWKWKTDGMKTFPHQGYFWDLCDAYPNVLNRRTAQIVAIVLCPYLCVFHIDEVKSAGFEIFVSLFGGLVAVGVVAILISFGILIFWVFSSLKARYISYIHAMKIRRVDNTIQQAKKIFEGTGKVIVLCNTGPLRSPYCLNNPRIDLRVNIVSDGYIRSLCCQFPRKLREDEKLFVVNAADVTLSGKGKGRYYRVRTNAEIIPVHL